MRSVAARSLHCNFLSLQPHTMRSRSISSSDSPYSQCSASLRSWATNSEMDSSACWTRELKLNRCTMGDGVGCWCSCTRVTSSAKFLEVGLTGARREWMSWYVAGPQELRRMARLQSASLTPILFAVKYISNRSVYDIHSSTVASNSPIAPCVTIFKVEWFCSWLHFEGSGRVYPRRQCNRQTRSGPPD